MNCIHGLDEINCPTCRISKLTFPLNPLSKIVKSKDLYRFGNPLFDNNRSFKKNEYKDFNIKDHTSQSYFHQLFPKLVQFGEIPNFSNILFEDRIKMLRFDKANPNYKVELDKHEIKFD